MNNQNQLTTANQQPVIIGSAAEASRAFSVANLIMHPFAMERVERYAAKLASSKNLLPQCFHNDTSACEALVIQAASLCMDPAGIGRHAFKAPNGTINFEAKVYQAIANVGAGIEFDEEWIGDWTNVIGKNVDRKTPLPDEKGLALKLTGTWPNGKIKTMTVFMSECMPRLSTNWKNNPRMQTYYSAIKQFLRRYQPAIIMGVFDRDDMQRDGETQEREINPVQKAQGKKSEPVGLDDVLNGEVEVSNETQVNTEPSGLDDVLGADFPDNVTADGEFIPSKFDEMIDILNEVGTEDDFWEARKSCTEVIEAGELSKEEARNIKMSLNTLRDSLGIQQA